MQHNSVSWSSSAAVVLTVPGLDGSGPGHWQTQWEGLLPECRRVQMPDWANPRREQWLDTLDRTVRGTSVRVIFAAHSLGCLAVAWWAKLRWTMQYSDKVAGALLVAPPAMGAHLVCQRLYDFLPAPGEALPFPSLLVASRNDPYCSFAVARDLADAWQSGFVDAGETGHINASSGLGEWVHGLTLLRDLATTRTKGGVAVEELLA
jgi:predicted alpha/beta hydrolase family esterase